LKLWRGLVVLAVLGGLAAMLALSRMGGGGQQLKTARLPPVDASSAATAMLNNETQANAATPEAAPPRAEDVQAQILALESAVREKPADLDSLTKLGGLYFQMRMYPRAADTFAMALELTPNDARLRTDFASSLLYQGMLGLAKREYLRAIAVDPSLPDPHFNLAVILSHSNPPDIPGAIVGWREVIRLAPDSDLARSAGEYMARYDQQEQPAAKAASP